MEIDSLAQLGGLGFVDRRALLIHSSDCKRTCRGDSLILRIGVNCRCSGSVKLNGDRVRSSLPWICTSDVPTDRASRFNRQLNCPLLPDSVGLVSEGEFVRPTNRISCLVRTVWINGNKPKLGCIRFPNRVRNYRARGGNLIVCRVMYPATLAGIARGNLKGGFASRVLVPTLIDCDSLNGVEGFDSRRLHQYLVCYQLFADKF